MKKDTSLLEGYYWPRGTRPKLDAQKQQRGITETITIKTREGGAEREMSRLKEGSVRKIRVPQDLRVSDNDPPWRVNEAVGPTLSSMRHRGFRWKPCEKAENSKRSRNTELHNRHSLVLDSLTSTRKTEYSVTVSLQKHLKRARLRF